MDPLQFVETVFSEPPKEEGSIQLQLDMDEMTMKDTFEFLLVVFTNGLRMLYGDRHGKVDLTQLSDDQFKHSNKYFASFGFDCQYVIYPLEAEQVIDFKKLSYLNVEETSQTKFKDLCFPIKVKDKIFVIGFQFLKDRDITPKN